MTTREPKRYTREAPAKINLALHVTGRRADGYHELDTLFLPLDLADTVTVAIDEAGRSDRTGSQVTCTCTGHPDLDGPDNLAAAAARRYLQRAGLAHAATVAIHIEKRIWVAAGLGGGSSDAAAVLRVLDEHLQALDSDELAALALSLGADVPYFLEPRVARGRGVGQLLEPICGIPPLHLGLVNPGRQLATREVFAALGMPPGTRRTTSLDGTIAALDGSVAAAAALVHNDLLPAALSLCPEISGLLEALRGQGALAAGLSGSGPTVFGIFDGAEAATTLPGVLSVRVVSRLAP